MEVDSDSLTTTICGSAFTSSYSSETEPTSDGDIPLPVVRSPWSCYQVLELLGHGTFGQVFQCKKKESNEMFAIKILKRHPAYAKQRQTEVQALTILRKVDCEGANIIQAYETFEHKGYTCIIFELLQISLRKYLNHHYQPLPLKYIRPIAHQILTCLEKLGELGIVHTDIKPENIMLVDPERQPFRVKVIDFGCATSPCNTPSTIHLQTRYYRSPEVILGAPFNTAIDMWSLGCVLAELFLGWPLFPGENEYEQISYICQMMGSPPSILTNNSTKICRFFNSDHSGRLFLKPPTQILKEAGIYPRLRRHFIFKSVRSIVPVTTHNSSNPFGKMNAEEIDKVQFQFLLEMLLKIDPRKRADPGNCLSYPFITMVHLKD